MKLQPFVEKLINAQTYKDFQKKYKDAFIIAGFFVLDYETGQNLHQLDYYVPSERKIAAFSLDKKVTVQLLDTINNQVPEKLDTKTKIDLDALPGILQDEMKNRNITEEIRKIIAVLQTIDGKKLWNLNCVLSGMSILNAHVDDDSETVLRMEKKSIIDYIKRMPMPMQMSSGGQQMEQASSVSSEEAENRIKKLEQLEAAIEEEKIEQAEKTEKSAGKKDKKENKDANMNKDIKQDNKVVKEAKKKK